MRNTDKTLAPGVLGPMCCIHRKSYAVHLFWVEVEGLTRRQPVGGGDYKANGSAPACVKEIKRIQPPKKKG